MELDATREVRWAHMVQAGEDVGQDSRPVFYGAIARRILEELLAGQHGEWMSSSGAFMLDVVKLP